MPDGFLITGELEINGAIETFERVALPAEIRKGTRAGAKLVEQEFKARVDVRSGAMRDATIVRALKRSRQRIGHMVKIDRNKLFALYEKRTGKPPTGRKGEGPFFYPAVQELGDKNNEPKRPLRGALYDNAQPVKHEVATAMLRAINHPKVKAKRK